MSTTAKLDNAGCNNDCTPSSVYCAGVGCQHYSSHHLLKNINLGLQTGVPACCTCYKDWKETCNIIEDIYQDIEHDVASPMEIWDEDTGYMAAKKGKISELDIIFGLMIIQTRLSDFKAKIDNGFNGMKYLTDACDLIEENLRVTE